MKPMCYKQETGGHGNDVYWGGPHRVLLGFIWRPRKHPLLASFVLGSHPWHWGPRGMGLPVRSVVGEM